MDFKFKLSLGSMGVEGHTELHNEILSQKNKHIPATEYFPSTCQALGLKREISRVLLGVGFTWRMGCRELNLHRVSSLLPVSTCASAFPLLEHGAKPSPGASKALKFPGPP